MRREPPRPARLGAAQPIFVSRSARRVGLRAGLAALAVLLAALAVVLALR